MSRCRRPGPLHVGALQSVGRDGDDNGGGGGRVGSGGDSSAVFVSETDIDEDSLPKEARTCIRQTYNEHWDDDVGNSKFENADPSSSASSVRLCNEHVHNRMMLDLNLPSFSDDADDDLQADNVISPLATILSVRTKADDDTAAAAAAKEESLFQRDEDYQLASMQRNNYIQQREDAKGYSSLSSSLARSKPSLWSSNAISTSSLQARVHCPISQSRHQSPPILLRPIIPPDDDYKDDSIYDLSIPEFLLPPWSSSSTGGAAATKDIDDIRSLPILLPYRSSGMTSSLVGSTMMPWTLSPPPPSSSEHQLLFPLQQPLSLCLPLSCSALASSPFICYATSWNDEGSRINDNQVDIDQDITDEENNVQSLQRDPAATKTADENKSSDDGEQHPEKDETEQRYVTVECMQITHFSSK